MSTSSLTAATTLPTADQLWMFAEIFRNDWSSGVSVSRDYKTNVEYALSASEQRYGLLSRPVHSMTVRFLGGGRDSEGTLQTAVHSGRRAMSALKYIAQRYTQAKSLWPLFSDESLVTQDITALDTTIFCDTENIRFAVGSRVLLIRPATSNRIDGPYYDLGSAPFVTEVTAVGSGQITVDVGPPSSNFDAGSRIIPLFEARLIFDVEGTVLTDSIIDLTVTAIEEEGSTQLPGTVPVGDSPAGLQSHDGLPIFDPDYDYSSEIKWGFSRRGQRSSAGISGLTEVYGSRGMFICEFPIKAVSRADAFDAIRMFDSRGGKLHPFWCIGPITDYYDFFDTVISNIGDTLILQFSVSTAGNNIDWNARPYIYIKMKTGVIHIREISSAALVANDLWLVTPITTLPFMSKSHVKSVGIAYKCRFDSDTMQENWKTTEIMESSLTFRELEEEKSITISDISELVISDLLVGSGIGQCAATFAFLLSPCGPCPCGTSMSVCNAIDEPSPLSDQDFFTVDAPEWAPSTAYAKGDHVIPVGATDFLQVFKAMNAGTSGGSEPSWPTECEDTQTDNDIVWEKTIRCYKVTAQPIECLWPMPSGTISETCDCDPLCTNILCDLAVSDYTLFTAECFCHAGCIGRLPDARCDCEQGVDCGCFVVDGTSIVCSVGTYVITIETGSTGSCCCNPNVPTCQMLRMTRTT